MGDIGKLFPDTDERFRGADSLLLLEDVMRRLEAANLKPVNVDVTIVAQRPKLRLFMDDMRVNLAKRLQLPLDCVNVKATTTERLGFEGEELGITAHAVCLLESR